jgi:hypothetical protein
MMRGGLSRFENEVGEVVSLAVVEGEDLESRGGKGNGADLGEVPVVIILGGHREVTLGRGFAV